MSSTIVIRVIAATIFGSGVLAALALFLSAGRFAPVRVLFPAAALLPLLFWIAVSGIGLWLWRGSRRSRTAASVLLASQIPVVAAGDVTYWWHTLAQVAITVQYVSGQTLLAAATKLGPAANFWFGRPNPSTTVGINLVAVVCLVALLRSSKTAQRDPPSV